MDPAGDQLEARAQQWAREAEERGLHIVPTAYYLEARKEGMPYENAIKVFHRALFLFEQRESRYVP